MTLLHMDTDDVNSLADHLNRAANEIVDTAHDLRRSAKRLNAQWDGGRSDQFLRRLSSAANAAENVAEDAKRLSRRVRAEVDEWLAADQDGAQRITGTIIPIPRPVPMPTPVPGNQRDLSDILAELAQGGGIGETIDGIWDWAEISLLFLASGFINISGGSSYADQVIIKGPQWAKDLWGVSSNLTHIKDGATAGHISSQARVVGALALIAPLLKTVDQWLVAAQTPHDDNLRAGVAMFTDTLVIFGTYLTLTYAGTAIGSHIGGWIGGGVGGLIGAGGGSVVPVAGTAVGGVTGGTGGAAAGAMIGGVVGGVIGNYLAGKAVDWYLKSDLRYNLIESIVNLIRPSKNPSIMPGTQGGGGAW